MESERPLQCTYRIYRKTVKIADPIFGDVEYSKTQFEKVLTSRGKKAVALFDKNTSASSKTE